MGFHELIDRVDEAKRQTKPPGEVAKELGISVEQAEELLFRQWYAARSEGLDPNPDSPLHFYDYRAAYKAGAEPEVSPVDGLPHWPSAFKKFGHPNMIVDGMDTRTETPWNPQIAERPDAVSWPKRKG